VPASGATISLSSSNPQAAPLPASVAVQGSTSFVRFHFATGQVTTQTAVTMTATIGSESTTQTFTVSPPSLRSIEGMPVRQNGGVVNGGIVMLNGQAPAGGAVVSLSSSSPAAQPPATVTVPAGVESVAFAMPTSQVTGDTPVTITATWKGVSAQAQTTLTPQPAPTSITLEPPTITSGSGTSGRVTAADPRDADITFSLSTSRPDLVSVPGSVIVPQFAAAGGFSIQTAAVSTRTLVDVSVSGGGVTLTATLTLDPFPTAPPPPPPPPPAPTVSALGLSPSTVIAGAISTGTVTLSSAAPSGGLAVALSSSSAAASVPSSVSVPAGATSASFDVSTASAGSATITATGGGASRTAVLTVNATAPPPPTTDTVTVSRAEWSGGRLRVEASSSRSGVTLSVYVTSSGTLLGTFAGGRFETTTAVSPGNVTVKSSGGGQASRAVVG
jgi:hypothetical protein